MENSGGSILSLLKQINDGIRLQLNNSLKTWDLTFSQMNVLRELHIRNGEASEKEIGTALGVSHPTIAGLVARLEKNGFVYTRADTRDRRKTIVCLTEKALRCKDAVDHEKKQHEQIFLNGLSGEDREILQNYLENILQNILSYTPDETSCRTALHQKKERSENTR